MKTQKFFLAGILCIIHLISFGQERKYLSINQPIEKKINHIRIVQDAKANILFLKSVNGNEKSRLEIQGGKYSEDTINAINSNMKNICKIIDDTLIVNNNDMISKYNVWLQIRLTEPVLSIILDKKSNAKIDFKHNIEQFRLIANEYSNCNFQNSSHFDSIYIEGKENSTIIFEDIYVVNYINMQLESKANFTAKRGGFNVEGTQIFHYPLYSANIYLFGSKYPQVEKISDPNSIWTLDDNIDRVGDLCLNMGVGISTVLAPKTYEKYKSNFAFSSDINLLFSINLTNYFGICTGASFISDNIKFQNPLTIDDNKLISFDPNSEVGISNYTSQINMMKIGIPVLFKYKPNKKKNLGVTFGVIPSYQFYSNISGLMNTFEKNGRTYYEYFNNKDYLNNFQLDSKLSINYDDFQVFFIYGLTPVFDTDIEQKVNLFKFGITFDIKGSTFK